MLDIHAQYVSPSLVRATQSGRLPVSYDSETKSFIFP
jgi:hypothetical protein